MTRKHFEAIATSLLNTRPRKEWTDKYQQWLFTCNDVAISLVPFNPQFDTDRFLDACGVE